METIIVAGLTRSGLTMTMQMLNAGGCSCEGSYPDFEPHPMGKIPWPKCRGKAVKLVDSHHHFPPPGDYCVIRLHRNMREQARSFNKLSGLFGGEPLELSRLVVSFRRDYARIDAWAKQQFRLIDLRFEHVLENPLRAAKRIARFAGPDFDCEKAASAVVERDPECLPYMLEFDMLRGTDA